MTDTATGTNASTNGRKERSTGLFQGWNFCGYFDGRGKNAAGYDFLGVKIVRPDGSTRVEQLSFDEYGPDEEPSVIVRAMQQVRHGAKVTVKVAPEAMPTRAGGQWLKATALDMRELEDR